MLTANDVNITVNDMMDFLKYYHYECTYDGVKTILDTWLENKGHLIEKFRKHPNWDENALALVFKDNAYELGFDKEALKNFCNWATTKLSKEICKDAIEYVDFSRLTRKYESLLDSLNNANNYIKEINAMSENEHLENNKLELDFDIDKIDAEIRKNKNELREIVNNISDKYTKYYSIDTYTDVYALKENYAKYIFAINALDYIRTNVNSNTVTIEQADRINTYVDVKAVEGMKLSRIIGKICKTVGLHEYKDIKTTYDADGNAIERDYGYNREFAIMADAINPHYYKRITVISLNPFDYWGMSFGYKWASCHTTDLDNVRGNSDSGHHYHGAYSSGTESYMLDGSSMIYYVLKEDYEGTKYWDEDKLNRCVFAVNEDGTAILQSRVYPDGRDGGDNSLAGQFRKNVQKVIATIFENNDYWRVEKGSSWCGDYTESYGTHYRDYTEYEDGTISFLVGVDRSEIKRIEVGHDPICPNCGYEHEKCDNIVCDDCLEENTRYCDRCGERIRDRDEMITASNGNVYCCENCANNDGYYYCEDTGEYEHEDDLHYCSDGEYHLEENCFYDSYIDEYIYGEPEVETYDGKFFESDYNARGMGYEQDYFTDDWFKAEDLMYDEYEDVYFDPNNCDVIETTDGEYFASEASAEDNGYHKEYYSDDWMHEDDLEWDDAREVWFDREASEVIYIEDEDLYFIDEDTAEENGYVKEFFTDEYVNKEDTRYQYDEYEEMYFDTQDPDVIKTVDGKFYASDESANDNDYFYDEVSKLYKPSELLDIEEYSYIDRGNPNSINAIANWFEEREIA